MSLKLNIMLKMRPNEMNLALELTTNKNVMKMPCLEFLSRILTCTLTFNVG